MPERSTITAALGPTNTGKTHRAIERLLTYDTGMIGLPLRLLAREVYDKISMRVGETRVALVTGEERRVPRKPDYWVCTVEAMPVEQEVDFLAVDEIQLAAHPQRGHVFTDRLLHARGRRETWFLGSDTMRRAVAALIPTARFADAPRFSRLSFTGAEKITRLPGRSAVVAFSTDQVYELAERLRANKGGSAVVLGSLSPRTRNAQVAMFQAGEVDTLVATDAIGMGLNLQVNHVAFAALHKFDGQETRRLDVAELGQIAGRAGRYQTDGTFGTVAPLELPLEVADDLQAHRFPSVERLIWRNSSLDFSSPSALLASLQERPRSPWLVLQREADDTDALALLAEDHEIRALAQGPAQVELLWQVCSIPDFRKLLLENHTALLREIFLQLSTRGELDQTWLAERIDALDDPLGDIDTLTARIAAIRTWTYVAHRESWLRNALGWQERTRQIEDRLSDALHEALIRRFVEKGRGVRRKTKPPVPSVHHPFARLAHLSTAVDLPPLADANTWAEELLDASHLRFSLDARGRIFFDDREVGQLTRGAKLLLPDVKLHGHETLPGGLRLRMQRRLLAFARDEVAALLDPLRGPAMQGISIAAEGIRLALEQSLGTILTQRHEAALRALSREDRVAFREMGVVLGKRAIYVAPMLAPESISRRAALARAFLDAPTPCPPPGAPSILLSPTVDPASFLFVGYLPCNPRAVRADLVERVLRAMQSRDAPDIDELALWLGCDPAEIPWIVDAMLSHP
ncbi:MAG: helicase-related protein [Myxococcales bacterium]|nr:helicase-related protein [Polyangiaceae bacterium]MDW8252003.1 helicase-related protein [Myxococcales bacterium]